MEYIDSLFMVLRRKNDQLSFLHCYHHLLMGWAWYAVVKYACGGDAYFGAIMNSFIHVVMYSYYAFRAVVRACCRGGGAAVGSACFLFFCCVLCRRLSGLMVSLPCAFCVPGFAQGITVPWKRQVTNLQMLQFVVCASHSIYLLLREDASTIYPPLLSALELFVMVNMLVLFSQFYRATYSRKPKEE